MNWLTVLTTIFDILWLIAVLVLLWFIWRSSERRTRVMEKAILNIATSRAETERMAAQTAHMLAEQATQKESGA